MSAGTMTGRNRRKLMATISRHAVLEWSGDVTGGGGRATAGNGAFAVAVTFPSTAGEAAGHTTPEELLAASHATCYGGLRSLIGRRGGRARRVVVTATITTEKGPRGIRITSSHLRGEVESLEDIDYATPQQMAQETRNRCTISMALEATVSITHDVVAR
jgi:osmotically inducible protein OsmC